jgi:PA14 domain
MKLLAILVCSVGALIAQEDGGEFRFGTTVVIPTGLQGKVYHISEFSKKLPANLEKKKPVGSIYTTSLNIPTQDFRAGFPGVTKKTEWFAIDYTGKFWIQMAGKYRFVLTSDDGSKLYIDDHLVIDNDGLHGTFAKDVAIELTQGTHRIRVSYFQGPGYEIALILEIEAPFLPRRVFNTDDYKPPSTLESPVAPIPHVL